MRKNTGKHEAEKTSDANSLFAGAEFGDKFRKADGATALFTRFDRIVGDEGETKADIVWAYTLEEGEMSYFTDGKVCDGDGKVFEDRRFDIVSRCGSQVSNMELDEMALEYIKGHFGPDYAVGIDGTREEVDELIRQDYESEIACFIDGVTAGMNLHKNGKFLAHEQ